MGWAGTRERPGGGRVGWAGTREGVTSESYLGAAREEVGAWVGKVGAATRHHKVRGGWRG